MTRRSCAALLVASAVLIVTPAVGAQAVGARIGAPAIRSNGREVLATSLNISASSVSNPEGQIAGSIPLAVSNPSLDSRYLADLRGSVRYNPLAGRVSLSVGGSSALRRYQTANEFTVMGHQGNANLRWSVGRRTSVSASGGVGYRPSYSFGPELAVNLAALPTEIGLLPESAVDFSVARRVAYMSDAAMTLGHRLTRRAAVNVGYFMNRREVTGALGSSTDSRNAFGRLNYSLTRGLGVHAGYGRRSTSFTRTAGTPSTATPAATPAVTPAAIDDIDVGLDFNQQPLSITRSTTLSFSSGSSIASVGGRRRVLVTGNASIGQLIGRTGRLSLTYQRGVQIQDGFLEPVFTNVVNTSGEFQFGRRIGLAVSGTQMMNSVGQSAGASNDYRMYSGSARLGYAISARGQIYAQYLAYNHVIANGVEIFETIPRDQTRHVIRVGLSWALPLVTARPQRN